MGRILQQLREMPPGRQAGIALAMLTIVLVLIFATYFLLFRQSYGILYSDLRPADAAKIVEQLEARNIAYRIGDNETTILVPDDQIAETRIAMAGSDMPLGGVIGFELFNESDMGLTEFAQKINYQRALQGELARTIILMQEVDHARVHLALPQRTIFRDDKTRPKAAVTITKRKGRTVDRRSVSGIRQLVASSVNGLALDDVTVLDETGRLLDAAGSGVAQPLPPRDAERAAIADYYRARIARAVETVIPGLSVDIMVSLGDIIPQPTPVPDGQDETVPDTASPDNISAEPSGTGLPSPSLQRNYSLQLRLVTRSRLNREETSLLAPAIREAVGFRDDAGDSLVFATHDMLTKDVAATDSQAVAPRTGAHTGQSVRHAVSTAVPASSRNMALMIAAFVAAIAGVIAIIIVRRRRQAQRMESGHGDALVERIITFFPESSEAL
ncbi:MAG: flagellar basal-body MS-ring/collar protein FliF [Pseudomonadota bacterium]